MDTIECLVRCQISVIRYRVRDSNLVDRLVGLCPPLLPIMYDVCQFAYESKCRNLLPMELNLVLFNRLNELVASWQVQPPAEFLTKFSTQEVTCLLIRAYVFKAAISLLLHRPQYLFGAEDQTAIRLSAEILSERATYSVWWVKLTSRRRHCFPGWWLRLKSRLRCGGQRS